MSETPPLALATVRNYDDLHFALRARVDALGVSNETLDDLAGFHPGYWSHVLGPSQPQNSIRALGKVSLGCALGTLGVKLILVHDEDAFAKIRDRLVARDNAQARRENAKPAGLMPRENAFVVLGRAGGHARMALLSAKQRVALARKASRARWRRVREAAR
jgi:hypothetical protein